MQPKTSNIGRRRFLIGALLTCIAIPVGFIGFVAYELNISHKDYEKVETCLQRHGLAVTDGWKQTDLVLEDFGLIFEVQSGQQWEIQILDGYSVRNCGDRIAGVLLSTDSIGSPNNKYLPIDQPLLLAALDKKEMRTLEDVVSQLEWLLAWAQAHPEALLSRDEISNLKQYVSLLSPPI